VLALHRFITNGFITERTTAFRCFIINLRFHDLRHEATSRLFEKGLRTEVVKAITGHKTYQMLDRYTHLKAEDIVRELG